MFNYFQNVIEEIAVW